MHNANVLSLFLFLILIYALKIKVRNDARDTPSSDHHVYISFMYIGFITNFFVVCTHMWLVKAETLT